VRRAFDAGKVIAAICHGPQLLIEAAIVRDRRATCYKSIAIDLKNAGGLYEMSPDSRLRLLICPRIGSNTRENGEDKI